MLWVRFVCTAIKSGRGTTVKETLSSPTSGFSSLKAILDAAVLNQGEFMLRGILAAGGYATDAVSLSCAGGLMIR